MVSEVFHIDQKPLKNRLLISFHLFAAGLLILVFSLANAQGFNTIWRYFAWLNQTLAAVTLWSITVFLYRDNKPYLISMIPALFMTMVVTTFIFISPTGFRLSPTLSYFLGGIITLAIMELFHIRERNLAAKSAPCR
jgi:carbon starvation protein CstA